MANNFDYYMAAVNCCIDKLCELSSDDLPDYDYASDFEDGVSAKDAALMAVKEAGLF